MGPLECSHVVVVAAEHVGGPPELLEVAARQRVLDLGTGEEAERVVPTLHGERGASLPKLSGIRGHGRLCAQRRMTHQTPAATGIRAVSIHQVASGFLLIARTAAMPTT